MTVKKVVQFQSTKEPLKNLIKNYLPISPLPIFSKVFERLTSTSLFNYFIQNKLFTECQSGFILHSGFTLPCVAQLLSTKHEILIVICHTIQEVPSLMFRKHLTKFGTNV